MQHFLAQDPSLPGAGDVPPPSFPSLPSLPSHSVRPEVRAVCGCGFPQASADLRVSSPQAASGLKETSGSRAERLGFLLGFARHPPLPQGGAQNSGFPICPGKSQFRKPHILVAASGGGGLVPRNKSHGRMHSNASSSSASKQAA